MADNLRADSQIIRTTDRTLIKNLLINNCVLEVFPDAKDQMVSFGIKSLATLTIESVHNFIVNKVIPRFASTWQRERMASARNSDGIEPVDNVADGISTISNAFLNAHMNKSYRYYWKSIVVGQHGISD
jgi:hypothetical protein